MKILVTGGAGYIGSHTCVNLLENNYEVVIVDNLYNSNEKVVDRITQITGKKPAFYNVDLLDKEALDSVFEKEKIDAVIHFAGLKAVGESVEKPIEYYHNNLTGTLHLVDCMRNHDVKNIIFSSSATVYGEQILTDLHTADNSWNVILLRYFNPIGAHKSGLIGEDPKGIPNNLVPYVAQVAVGKRECLGVFGNDYKTHDGTGVRDYVHVVDLADGHVKALEKIKENCGVKIYNLGTGKGSSVLDVVHAYEKACGKKIPYEIKPRRAGDLDELYSQCDKAEKELHWTAKYDLNDMCADSWKWQSMNPNGYND